MAEPIPCPSCQRPLNVPETFFGRLVECPDCKHRFIAGTPGAVQASPPPLVSAAPREESAGIAEGPAASPRAYVDDELPEERERERDRDDLRVRRRGYEMPHRGSMIMTLGILSIFLVPLVLGTLAWFLGNADLRAMEEGRMDPEGESQTRTGRTIGMVMVIINLVTLVLTFCFLCVMFGGMFTLRGN